MTLCRQDGTSQFHLSGTTWAGTVQPKDEPRFPLKWWAKWIVLFFCSPSLSEKQQGIQMRAVEDESSEILMLDTILFIPWSDPNKAGPSRHWSEGCMFKRRTMLCSKINESAFLNISKSKQLDLGVPTSFSPPPAEKSVSWWLRISSRYFPTPLVSVKIKPVPHWFPTLTPHALRWSI